VVEEGRDATGKEGKMNIDSLKTRERGTPCAGCGLPIFGSALRLHGAGGACCNMACLETVLFGHGRCRWCGTPMDKAYLGVESRLCSDDCSENYWKHVMGDKSAALGTGKRFAGWLQAKLPEMYRSLVQNIHEKGKE
jgi:hypothetical protein